jgi:hypothetical protein
MGLSRAAGAAARALGRARIAYVETSTVRRLHIW